MLDINVNLFYQLSEKPTSWYTTYEWIASKYRGTSANWIMIQHLATSGYTTRTKARIVTFHVNTGLVQWTISINYALGSAGWRISYEFRYTCTYCLIIKALASTIRTAGWRITWILNNSFCKSNFYRNRFLCKTSL